MKKSQFRIFYQENIDLLAFSNYLSRFGVACSSLKDGSMPVSSAPMVNLERRKSYILDLSPRQCELVPSPIKLIEDLHIEGCYSIDELSYNSAGGKKRILEIIPFVEAVELKKVVQALLPHYGGFLREARYPSIYDRDQRSAGFMALLNGPENMGEMVQDKLWRMSNRSSMSIESECPRTLASLS